MIRKTEQLRGSNKSVRARGGLYGDNGVKASDGGSRAGRVAVENDRRSAPFPGHCQADGHEPGDAFAGCRDCTATCLYTVGQVSVRNHDAEYASAAAIRGGGSTLPFGTDGPCHLNGLPPPRFVGPESGNPGRSPLPDGYCAWWSTTPSGNQTLLGEAPERDHQHAGQSHYQSLADVPVGSSTCPVPCHERTLRLVHQHPRQTTDRSSVHPRDHGEQSTSEIPSASNIGSCDDGKQRCLQDGMAGELCERSR